MNPSFGLERQKIEDLERDLAEAAVWGLGFRV